MDAVLYFAETIASTNEEITGVCSRVVLEQISGVLATTHELTAVPVIIDVHLYGLLLALLIALGSQAHTILVAYW